MNTEVQSFFALLVGLDGLEPSTSRLSGVRSSHLSYRPVSLRLFSSVHLCCLRWDSEPLTQLRRVVWLLSTTHFQQFSLHDACIVDRKLVEMMGIEPMTPCLQGRCSPSWATPPLKMRFEFSFRSLKIEQQAKNTRFVIALSLAVFFGFGLLKNYKLSTTRSL